MSSSDGGAPASPSPGAIGAPNALLPSDDGDPNAWLEDVEGAEALTWVERHNAAALEQLAGGTRFAELKSRILQVLDSDDRLPLASIRGGFAYNFWQDAAHERGVWRRTDPRSYETDSPDWDVLLDLDELSAREGTDWVFHGAALLRPDFDRALIELSRGGSDADESREFDLTNRTFVEDGFHRPEAKGSVSWAGRDELLVTNDFGPGTMSSSGYPLQARRWRRGTDLADAKIVFRGEDTDMLVAAWHDPTPGFERDLASRQLTFFTSRLYVLADDGPHQVVAPDSADKSIWRDWLIIRLRDQWRGHVPGSLLVAPLAAALAGEYEPVALLTPTDTQTLESATCTSTRIVATLLDDVRPLVRIFTPPAQSADADPRPSLDAGPCPSADAPVGGAPASAATGRDSDGRDDPDRDGDGRDDPDRDGDGRDDPDRDGDGRDDPDQDGDGRDGTDHEGDGRWQVAEPAIGGEPESVSYGPLDPIESDEVWRMTTGFLAPARLARGPALGEQREVKRAPAFFDASGLHVTQRFVVSDDGTRVPYFLVAHEDLPLDGTTPTLLYGYGGFEISETPGYSGVLGRAWLERGFAYAVANIRGGGEYGPRWHQAALTRDRHRAYEDFAAVARDLTATGVTSAARLGAMGGSNGGLLTGNMLTHYPELFGAIVIRVPLLDMRRYSHLLAGASWIAEYGDPDEGDQWAFIRTFSPYHLLDSARRYPPVLLTTSTRDDRVHPAHARKMTAALESIGADVTYYENTEGGHAGASTHAQQALMQALAYEFLADRLTHTG